MSSFSHVPVVTLLLRAGTDLTTIDNNGRYVRTYIALLKMPVKGWRLMLHLYLIPVLLLVFKCHKISPGILLATSG